jgi:uncharacterized membrane protein YjjB (DUF3815 family)
VNPAESVPAVKLNSPSTLRHSFSLSPTTDAMRLWRHAKITAVLFAALIALMPGALADVDMISLLRDIVTAYLDPTVTAADAGGLAAAVYFEGHIEFFNSRSSAATAFRSAN